jgi:hypothetical protein
MMKVPFEGVEREAIDREFKTIREEWNEYELNDGTRIRLKAVVQNISQLVDDNGAPVMHNGELVFVVRHSAVVSSKHREH